MDGYSTYDHISSCPSSQYLDAKVAAQLHFKKEFVQNVLSNGALPYMNLWITLSICFLCRIHSLDRRLWTRETQECHLH